MKNPQVRMQCLRVNRRHSEAFSCGRLPTKGVMWKVSYEGINTPKKTSVSVEYKCSIQSANSVNMVRPLTFLSLFCFCLCWTALSARLRSRSIARRLSSASRILLSHSSFVIRCSFAEIWTGLVLDEYKIVIHHRASRNFLMYNGQKFK